MEKTMQNMFQIQENQDGTLRALRHCADRHQMNWVEGEHAWGTTRQPDAIHVDITRSFLENGNLLERYSFRNDSLFPVFFKKNEVGVYTTFNDDYKDVLVSLPRRCNTHVWCAGEASYVMALRMGGEAPHLGLKLVRGSLSGYSTEKCMQIKRRMEEISDDRGDIILHPDLYCLEPNETYELAWELFWFDSREDFWARLLESPDFPVVRTQRTTYFPGETMRFSVQFGRMLQPDDVQIRINGEKQPFTLATRPFGCEAHCECLAEKQAEQVVEIQMAGKRTTALFYVCKSLRELAAKRCQFIAEKQQYHNPASALDGAYLVYDNEDRRLYYAHLLGDQNGCRERIGMGCLMALWLQKEPNDTLRQSLEQYERFIYREIFDEKTGAVSNDIGHTEMAQHRYYNDAWVSTFLMELYALKKERKYLQDLYTLLHWYFSLDKVEEFYPLCFFIEEILIHMHEAGMEREAVQLQADFIRCADAFLQHGTNYKASEVTFEQSMVAPLTNCLLQAYQISEDEKYLRGVERQLEILSLYHAEQPDYHLFFTSIRHWDGYWFGKRANFGDTLPHQWSALTGEVYARCGTIRNDTQLLMAASNIFRGCLNLFKPDGTASCAMVYPQTVNGKPGHYYDPWANDQDWAMYYALKYERLV